MPVVTIQPDAALGKNVFLSNADVNTNFSPTSVLHIQSVNQRKALVHFDLAPIPNNATITSAILTLYQTTSIAAATIAVHRSLVEWFGGNGGAGTTTIRGSTWNFRNHIGSVAWAGGAGGAAGSDYATTATASQSVGSTIGAYDWNVTADVTNILNGTNLNLGWWFVATAGTTSIKSFAGASSATPSQRPKLTITYTMPGMGDTFVFQPDNYSGKDTEIESNLPTANYGVRDDFHIGQTPAGATWKALVQFDLSQFLSSDIVVSATLRLWCSAEDTTTDTALSIYRGLVDWFEGFENGASPNAQNGSTWNLRNALGAVAWSGGVGGAAGSDYASSATSSSPSITAAGAFYDWDVTVDVQAFINGSVTNRGWWIMRPTALAGSRKFFSSSENATAANRPQLLITLIRGVMSASSAGTSTATAHMIGWADLEGSAAGTSTADADADAERWMAGSAAGTSTADANMERDRLLRGSAAGTSTAVATLIGIAAGKKFIEACEITPLLYITDGNIKPNGQLDMLDLINPQVGYMLKDWNPAIAQYKSGGYFSDSPLAEGRRLARRVFENAIEVFTLALKSHNQNRVIQFTRDFFRWKEAASDYWVSDWLLRPVYIVARAPQETEIRYAPIHVMDIPALTNPYGQPFYGRQWSAIENIALRLERGAWSDQPPGMSEPVAISSIRSYTVADWGISP